MTPKIWLHRGTIYMNGVPTDKDPDFANRMWKHVGNAKYHGGHSRWVMPLSRETVAGLRAMNFSLPPRFATWEAEQARLAVKRKEANRLKGASGRELRERLETAGVRFKRDLFEHQLRGAAFAIRLPAAALLMDTGTGKTATMATVMQAFVDKLGFKKMLVVAPKTILNTGWGEDIDGFSWLKWVNISNPPRREEVTKCPVCKKVFKKHVQWRHMKTHMTKAVGSMGEEKAKDALYIKYPELVSPAKDDRRKRLLRALKSDEHEVFLINPEGFKLVLDELMDQDWDMVVVDESSMLKSPKSAITQKMQLFGGSVSRRYIMTATPRPNSSLDFWGQMAFLDQSLGGNYYAFRDKYFYQGYDGFSWHPKDAESTDHKIWDIVSQRSYRVKLEDCVDLPGETTERMEVTLSGTIDAHYQDMLMKMAVMVENGVDDEGKVIDTQWRIVQMNKLAQITSGYVFDNDGEVEFLGDSEKIKATLTMAKRLIEDEDRFVVIWARFAEEMRMIEEELEKYGVSTCHGRTKNVDKSVADFKARRTRVMIAHARSAQFGHTWVHSNAAIFHSYDYSWEAFYQAKRRIYRLGQTTPVTYIVNVARGTVDEEILAKVFAKEEASDAVVDDNVFSKLLHLRKMKRRG
jgi:SNF2 family DNA or RNA helicase